MPLGWAYEGWVVLDGVPYSTGKFVDPGDADWDGGGPTAGPGVLQGLSNMAMDTNPTGVAWFE